MLNFGTDEQVEYSRETGIERLMRDAEGAQIYEGTNQIHRLIVADAVLDGAKQGA